MWFIPVGQVSSHTIVCYDSPLPCLVLTYRRLQGEEEVRFLRKAGLFIFSDMASEITYAEVKFKNESNSSGTYSDSPAAPKEKPIRHQSKPGSPSLLFISLMALVLLLAISFLAAFIIYFQKYSQLLEEKKSTTDLTHNELNCIKNIHSPPKDKVWSCCPENWKPFGSNCYFTSTDSASWSESEQKCSSMGAHLVVIHSKEEQDFITGILNTAAAYFIGLRDEGHRQWRWVDRTPYNESATFWHNGEPSSKEEKCVILNYPKRLWGWNDIRCSNVAERSICQLKRIYL
ncbi:C-type lectin domain family 4 member A-like isoform X2 [Acomys russatus]|uniref:C-type lectin domain family 4 member A-like isoform X2 n=1 Tax=Acomys russatus TaxID=60746 RepID=UPI0021E31509|nr:C-type lectin domain family 4 member A-like isoform X2 [Acomys russatus]